MCSRKNTLICRCLRLSFGNAPLKVGQLGTTALLFLQQALAADLISYGFYGGLETSWKNPMLKRWTLWCNILSIQQLIERQGHYLYWSKKMAHWE